MSGLFPALRTFSSGGGYNDPRDNDDVQEQHTSCPIGTSEALEVDKCGEVNSLALLRLVADGVVNYRCSRLVRVTVYRDPQEVDSSQVYQLSALQTIMDANRPSESTTICVKPVRLWKIQCSPRSRNLTRVAY